MGVSITAHTKFPIVLLRSHSGTGVGLVNKAGPAGDIVKEVRDEAKDVIRQLAGSI